MTYNPVLPNLPSQKPTDERDDLGLPSEGDPLDFARAFFAACNHDEATAASH